MNFKYLEVAQAALLLLLLGSTVVSDIRDHRIPNIVLLVGVIASAVLQIGLHGGTGGVLLWLGGLAVGLLFFLPLYMFGGMAAGDVKLMAMVGGFLGPVTTFLAATFSLISGAVLGVLILLYKKQLYRFIQRYWAMASLRAYIRPEADDAARQRFPYAIAILLGTLASLYWQPISI